jgi:hypothetical protein
MFARTSWKEFVIRTLLSAVMLVSALGPTTAVAQAKQITGSTRHSNLSATREESRAFPTFERPEPRAEY